MYMYAWRYDIPGMYGDRYGWEGGSKVGYVRDRIDGKGVVTYTCANIGRVEYSDSSDFRVIQKELKHTTGVWRHIL